MIALKTKDPNMTAHLLSVLKALLEKWQMDTFDEDAVFRRLQLDDAGDKLFTHPTLDVWYHRTDPGAFISRVIKKSYRDYRIAS